MIKYTLLFAALFTSLGSLLSGCFSHAPINGTEISLASTNPIGQTIEGIVYTDENWGEPLRADLYLPQKAGLHPVVLMIHGGGWAARSRSDMDSVSQKLTRHGYAVLNLSYRLAPDYQFPTQLDDVRQALRWVADNAGRYGFDTDRVNTWGYSSGAHLAALIGGYDSPKTQAPANKLPAINAIVAGGIPSDLRKYSGSPLVMDFLGGDRDEIPQTYAEASPAYHISANDPPVFLYHGKQDTLVGVDQAHDYYQALLKAGVNAELYLQNWRGHYTMFLFGGEAEKRAIDFLNRKNS